MAKAAEDRNLVIPAVSATIFAAVSPPQPGISNSSGMRASIAFSKRLVSWPMRRVTAVMRSMSSSAISARTLWGSRSTRS
jgi:hypothetical protein